MRVVVLQEELFKSLAIVSRFVSPRAHLPILSNILISTHKRGIKIAATNLETGINCFIGAKIENEGALTLPAKTLVELVANLPPGKLTLEVESETLVVSNNKAHVSLLGIAASEFPQVPDIVQKTDFNINSTILSLLKNEVVYASSSDDARPTLTGVLLTFQEDRLVAVATDGFRLSYKEVLVKTGYSDNSVIIPAKLIDEVDKIIADKEETINITILENTKQIIFVFGNFVLTGRLIEGEFPSYQKIIPSSHVFKFITSKEELLRAVKIIGVIAREAANVMRLKAIKGGLELNAENKQYGSEEVKVEAETLGEEIETAFNYRYVLDFLNSVKGEDVCFETNGPSAPGVFKDNKDKSYFHLIMPVKIKIQD